MAAKGQAKTGGRRKGTPNKLNADVKAMILAALAAKGGQKYLEKQADENPTAFLTLVGKIIPLRSPARTAARSSIRASTCPPKRRERNGLLAKRKNAKRSSLCIEMRRRANAEIPH